MWTRTRAAGPRWWSRVSPARARISTVKAGRSKAELSGRLATCGGSRSGDIPGCLHGVGRFDYPECVRHRRTREMVVSAEAGTGGVDAPGGGGPGRGSGARVEDHVLGGKAHYRVDGEERGRRGRVMSGVGDLPFENRRYLIRVCRFLAERAGVEQYLDCGSGLPTTENVHQV